jgi:hypothetical protein
MPIILGMRTRPHITRDPGIEHAVNAAGGTFKALAAALGINAQAIAGWPQIPAARAIEIVEKVPGTKLHIMRPDLWQEEPPR